MTRRSWVPFAACLWALLAVAAAVRAEPLELVGSGDCLRLFKSLESEYEKLRPDIGLINAPPVGSTAGIRAVIEGRAAAARVIRDVKPDEAKEGALFHPAAEIPLTFFASGNPGVDAPTPDQIGAIFHGRTRNWRELGGVDRRIFPLVREPGDTMRKRLEVFAPELVGAEPKHVKVYYSGESMLDDARRHPGAVGLIGITEVKDDPAFTLFPPPKDAMAMRPLLAGLVYKERPSPELADFMAFLRSAAAQAVILSLGAAPPAP